MKRILFSADELEFIYELYAEGDSITYKEIADAVNDTFYDSKPVRKVARIKKIVENMLQNHEI